MNTLYYSPGTCAIGIHVLLEEIGEPYKLEKVDLAVRAQYDPSYLAINAKSKVPALRRSDGTVLTEYPAISLYLALSYPAKHLVPQDIEGQVRALEIMDYVTGTLHVAWRGFWRPSNIVTNESEHPALKVRGKNAVMKGLSLLDRQLADNDYLLGAFSIADAALYFQEFWVAERGKMELPPHCAAHYARMSARPSVRAMLRQQGLAT
jgi:glutathione S-transferase